jgi:O-acetyl-ADP-ribose deacetylase (regulator of RNase III)
MIKEIDANLLEFPLEGLMHQANCMHVMGSGIAKSIREKYPEAYHADVTSGNKGSNRLGTYSVAQTKDGKWIYNLYGQFNYGTHTRQTSYDAVCNGLVKIRKNIEEKNLKTFGCPKLMGCALGGGSWDIVRAIINDVFEDCEIEFYVCNYQPK